MSELVGPERALAAVLPRTRRDDVSSAIRRAILVGELPRGARLREAPLAAALQVSRPTLREAIRTLVYEGIVVEEPFRGARVADPSPQSILDVASIRVALETLACQTLVERLESRNESALEKAFGEIVLARDAIDALGLAEAHSSFHRVVVQSARNALLEQVWQWLEGHIHLALTVDQIVHPDFNRMVNSHQAYLDILRTGQSDQISTEVRRHIFDQALDSAAQRRA